MEWGFGSKQRSAPNSTKPPILKKAFAGSELPALTSRWLAGSTLLPLPLLNRRPASRVTSAYSPVKPGDIPALADEPASGVEFNSSSRCWYPEPLLGRRRGGFFLSAGRAAGGGAVPKPTSHGAAAINCRPCGDVLAAASWSRCAHNERAAIVTTCPC